ncbi:MAG TPA: hypothetical protein VKQ72_07925, partial [Aggregatilineales bacterium]|nr:hypothetical protein [Aggregatilineales bacterium]
MSAQSRKPGAKHQLIVYRSRGARYRPVALLLILVGVVALSPTVVPAVRSVLHVPNFLIPLNYSQLAILGIAALVLGLVLFTISILLVRQAYVQCLPDFLLVNTLLHRVYVSYQRVNSYQPVQVGRIWDIKLDKKTGGKNALTDQEKQTIKPLLADTALEVELREFPFPEQKLRKTFSRFLFSTRETGFIFIIPKPPALSIELSSF